MAYDLTEKLVIGISSRALFDLEEANRVFETEGEAAYRAYQREREDELLDKGTAFPLVEAFLRLNSIAESPLVEVVVMSRNTPDTGLRIFRSIENYGLDVTRAVFAGGTSPHRYLDPFKVDLFLSKKPEDVQEAVNCEVAAAVICNPPQGFNPDEHQIRIAFDGDAVLFSDESERIFKEQGLDAFLRHEKEKAKEPMAEGPFAKFLKTLSRVQSMVLSDTHDRPVRIALVTARNSPAHERVILTLRAWGIDIDEAFFLGGMSKHEVLRTFNAHIFFDDQQVHTDAAQCLVPSGRVPYRAGSAMSDFAIPAPFVRRVEPVSDDAPSAPSSGGTASGGSVKE